MDNSISTEKNAQINSKAEFTAFLKSFYSDFINNKSDWENGDLESFLEALIAYSEDIDGFYTNMNIDVNTDLPSWRLFADMLCGASIYE